MGAVTDKSRLAIIKESVKGTTPATPAYKILRQTDNDLGSKLDYGESDEIVATRGLADYLLLGRDISGNMNVEWSFDAHDIMLEGAMCKAWVLSAERNGTEITSASATPATSYVVASGTAFAQYMLLRARGFAVAANNRLFVAASGSNATNVAAAGAGAVEASPPATARIKCIGFEGPTGDVQATATGLSSTVLDFTTMGLQPGQAIYVGGDATANQFATAAVKGWARVSLSVAVTATALTLDRLPSGWGVDAGVGKNIRVYFGDMLTDGTTELTYSIDRTRTDIAVTEVLKGVMIDGFALKGVADDKVDGEFRSIGFGYQSTAVAGSTYLDQSDAKVFNGSSNVEYVLLNEVNVRAGLNVLQGLDLDLSNNVRKDPGWGAFGGVGTSLGKCVISGTIGLYFGDKTFTDISEANGETTLRFALKDALHNALAFDVHRVKLQGSPPGDEGSSVSVVSQFEYRALTYRPTLGPIRQMTISQLEEIGA